MKASKFLPTKFGFGMISLAICLGAALGVTYSKYVLIGLFIALSFLVIDLFWRPQRLWEKILKIMVWLLFFGGSVVGLFLDPWKTNFVPFTCLACYGAILATGLMLVLGLMEEFSREKRLPDGTIYHESDIVRWNVVNAWTGRSMLTLTPVMFMVTIAANIGKYRLLVNVGIIIVQIVFGFVLDLILRKREERRNATEQSQE